jgi:3',5'-cyclic AMP phosphodiesterase CpdA
VFAVVADPQIGMVQVERDRTRFAAVVAEINKQGGEYRPAFVVIPGDLVHHAGNADEIAAFQAVVRTMQMPVHTLPGNHDEAVKDTFGQADRFRFEHHGWVFVGVNGNLWSGGAAAARQQFEWLATQLHARKPGTPVFVVQHQPLYVDGAGENDAYTNTPLAWRQKLLQLFEETKIAAVLTGHLHRNVTGGYRGIALLSTPSTCQNFDTSPPGYRLFRVTRDGFMETFVGVKVPA